jgi:hypothetical protein
MLTLDYRGSLFMCSLLPYVAHPSRAIDANWLLSPTGWYTAPHSRRPGPLAPLRLIPARDVVHSVLSRRALVVKRCSGHSRSTRRPCAFGGGARRDGRDARRDGATQTGPTRDDHQLYDRHATGAHADAAGGDDDESTTSGSIGRCTCRCIQAILARQAITPCVLRPAPSPAAAIDRPIPSCLDCAASSNVLFSVRRLGRDCSRRQCSILIQTSLNANQPQNRRRVQARGSRILDRCAGRRAASTRIEANASGRGARVVLNENWIRCTMNSINRDLRLRLSCSFFVSSPVVRPLHSSRWSTP